MGNRRVPPLTDRVVGAVLLGGRSSRFGSDKALAEVGDTVMGAVVVAALREAGVDPIVAVGGTAGPRLNLITVPDHWPGEGPLTALATILRWAREGRVVVVPCDLPNLTATAVAALMAASEALEPANRLETAVVATVDARPVHSVGLWPAAWAVPLRRLVDGGERRFQAALDVGPWIGVEVPGFTIADADTPSELERRTEN